MKLFTKVTSILLALTISPFTAFVGAGVASAEQQVSTKANEPIVKLLSAMEIIDDTFEFQYLKKITRMEFAMVVAKAGGYSIEGAEYKGIFDDVSEDNEYALYIEALQAAGVVSGEGKQFAPDRDITCTEAVVMLLRAAGYGPIAEANGGYPKGYMSIARSEGLLKNITSSNEITGDDMLVLVYNMLELKAVGFSTPDGIELDENETIMSQRHYIYHRRGLVTANSNTSLRADSRVKFGNVVIDTNSELIEMSAGKTDISDKLGYNVTVYYRYDKKTDTSECIYYEAEARNGVVSIDLKNLIGYSDEQIKYHEAETNAKRDITIENPAIIYNNVYYQGQFLTTDSFKGMVGKLTAVDNNSDNKYDIIAIEAYNTYVVNNAVSKDETFYDKISGACVDLSIEHTDNYELVFDDGKPAVFGDLCEDVVVSVSKTSPEENSKINRVIISTKKVSGSYTGFDTDERNQKYIEIDGLDRYYLLDSVKPAMLPKTGNGITLFLDAFDNGVYVSTKFLSDMRYGFMIDYKYRTMKDEVIITLYTAEGKIEQVNCAEKTKIDGETCEGGVAINTALSSVSTLKVNSDILPQGTVPVRYRMSEDGEIKSIDTPDKGANEGTSSLTFIKSATQVYSSSTFGYAVPVDGDTTILTLSLVDKTDKSCYKEEESFGFRGVNSSYPREKIRYTYCAFKVDPNSEYADYVLIFTSYGGHEKEDPFFVVDNYNARVYDEETEEVFIRLDGYNGGKQTSYYVAKEYEDAFISKKLKPGDVIRCSTDIDERLCDVEGPVITYDSEDKQITFDNISEGTSDVSKIRQSEQSVVALCGDVDLRKEGLLKIYHLQWGKTYSTNTTRESIKNDADREVFYVKMDGTIPVTVYDAKGNNDEVVYSGTYDDIISMENGFSKHSIALLRYRSNVLQEVVVLNNLYNGD